MSISSAFNIARSGLSTTEGRANLVAGNIANAQTEGYARREAVQVTENNSVDLRVARQVDENLAGMSRGASAQLGAASVTSEVLGSYLLTLGEPGDEVSPAARLAEFQAGLDLLANNPSDPAAQNDLLSRSETLVSSINQAAVALEASRVQAGDSFVLGVSEVNGALADIAQLNERLRLAGTDGTGTARWIFKAAGNQTDR